jgi:formylglycine-generating enzyme required for sulfatase activity
MINKYFLLILIILISGCQASNQTKGDGSVSLNTSSSTNFTNLVAGKVFQDRLKDGSLGPKMVVIPAGSFRMGDIQGGGDDDEQPVHRVSVGKFAMGVYEVTFAEYDKFAEADGRTKPDDRGWGRGNRPVINVSWNDATAYTKWLSNQTGKKYRLPTEAEWEYAARAGTETKYWWGNEIDESKANYDWNLSKTSPVGNYKANQFGLYDTVGNVWEWTCSEYEGKYNGKEKQCVTTANRLSLRGGSWDDDAWFVRSAYRVRLTPTDRIFVVGFRVSRH